VEIDVERAEAQLDALIERHALEAEAANWEARAWVESAKRYELRHAAERRAAWAEFYRAQIRAAEGMRERAVQRLGRLIDQEAGGADPIPGRLPHAR
jgi:hypothetical protein